MKTIPLIFLTFLSCILESYGANILFFVMPQSSSHRRSLYPLAEALASRGHRVTFFIELAYDEGLRSKHPNVTERIALIEHDDPSFYELWAYRNSSSFSDVQWTMHSDFPWIWNVYWSMMIDVCRITVDQKHTMMSEVIKETSWDLVVIDGIFAACGVAMTKMLKVPYIILNPTCMTAAEASHRSVPYPAAVVPPIAAVRDFDQRRFYHRFHSMLSYVVEYAMPFYWNWLLRDAVSPKFGDVLLGDESSLITWFYEHPELSYSDLPSIVEYPRPQLPDQALIAGHCKTGSPVLDDLEWLRFVDDPNSKGTILLSFGHIVQWGLAPRAIVETLFSAFDHLTDYRIVFQFDGHQQRSSSTSQPHVKTAPWLPVVGILNHPKTKLHLTHGGIKSIAESICASVPLVILPIFAEQVRNANLIKKNGLGLALDKLNLTTENIVRVLTTVLEDENFGVRVKKMKAIMTEQVRPPLELGVFWAERVIKRKGLNDKYYKHKGRRLSWIVHFNLDVLAVGFGLSVALSTVAWKVIRMIVKRWVG